MSKRAVLYARVSTDEQADKGYSLPSQLDACRKYAERLGYVVVAEFQEDYTGAVPMYERPEGKKLSEMLKRRDADVVVAYCIDRYYRDHVDLLVSVRQWLRAGIEIHACDMGKVESEYDIVLLIKGWQGSDERKKIIERTSRGRNGKASAGKVVGNGKAPYGYKYATGVFVIVATEAKTVRLIYRWYAVGDETGVPLSAYRIAERLGAMGIPAPSASDGVKRRLVRGTNIWRIVTIMRILKSETYAGVWHYGKRIGANGKGGQRPESEQITVQVPALIDRATWEATQARIEYNKQMSKRNGKREYLLRGRVRCAQCEHLMAGNSLKNGKHRYYRCARQYFAKLGERACVKIRVNADVIEPQVWKYVLSVMTNPKRFRKALRNAQKAEQRASESRHDQLEIVTEQIAESEAEAAKLAEAVKNVKGGAVGKALQEKIDRLEILYLQQIHKRDELQAGLSAQRLTDENMAKALRFREDIMAGLQNPTFEDKRRALELLQVEVIVTVDKKASVKCLVPVGERVIDLHTSRNAGQSNLRRWSSDEIRRRAGRTFRRVPSCRASS